MIIALLLLLASCFAQSDMKDYAGGWKGQLADSTAFTLTVRIQQLKEGHFSLAIYRANRLLIQKIFAPGQPYFIVKLDSLTAFRGKLHQNGEITGFMESGVLLYHLAFSKTGKGVFTGKWNIWMVDRLIPASIYLNIEDAKGEQYAAYPIFDDQRFTGTWAGGFSKKEDSLFFHDVKTGVSFKGMIKHGKLYFDILLADAILTSVVFEKYDGAFPVVQHYPPVSVHDGRQVSGLPLKEINSTFLRRMEDSIAANKITNTHSILIASKGKLVYEKYFSGFTPSIPHDLRSAAKSISSAITGIAIDKGLIRDPQQKLYDFLPEKYQYTRKNDKRKSAITLHSLLTMSSGIDAIDFGTDRNTAAAENNYQSTPDWTRTILEAPMINTPATHAWYGSANAYLLGVVLRSVVAEPLAFFMDDNLLAPLGITNYIIQNDVTGYPYFGGGMYLQPRDMLKFGQLYLDKGKWKGQRIISESWIGKSFQKYFLLENRKDSIEYGYLWWHKNYTVGKTNIHAVEARGAGGQYIFVINSLDLVVVITSGNYNNGRFWQPEAILEKYILPAILH
ncbi:serine hydrolase [Chitinophaga sp. MM2321]|uniref:serine hydrolase domain-containing protein n=1 Tax=Chitinophaga sp. MM2321 TaxID=3137178 RepID=UPI0032D56FBD